MNRTLEREIVAFAVSVEAQLARLVQEADPYLHGWGKNEQVEIIKRAVTTLWRQRADFDPRKSALATFFGSVLKTVIKNTPYYNGAPVWFAFTDEELAVLRAFGAVRSAPSEFIPPIIGIELEDGTEKTYTALQTTIGDPVVKVGKECAPCWKCKWFYGWLPQGEIDNSGIRDSEMREICDKIDRRKVEIAQQVRKGLNWNEADLQLE